MTIQLKAGDVVTIGQRPRTDDAGKALSNRILRAYTRPRGQTTVEAEIDEDGVKVTAVGPGSAIVDVIDEASEPAGVNYRFDVPAPPRAIVGDAPISR